MYQIEIFESKALAAERTIAQMRTDLEKYAQKEDASDRAIAQRNSMIATLFDFLNTANATVATLNTAYQEAIPYKGLYTKTKRELENTQPVDVAELPHERETRRYSSIEQVRKDLPNLF